MIPQCLSQSMVVHQSGNPHKDLKQAMHADEEVATVACLVEPEAAQATSRDNGEPISPNTICIEENLDENKGNSTEQGPAKYLKARCIIFLSVTWSAPVPAHSGDFKSLFPQLPVCGSLI